MYWVFFKLFCLTDRLDQWCLKFRSNFDILLIKYWRLRAFISLNNDFINGSWFKHASKMQLLINTLMSWLHLGYLKNIFFLRFVQQRGKIHSKDHNNKVIMVRWPDHSDSPWNSFTHTPFSHVCVCLRVCFQHTRSLSFITHTHTQGRLHENQILQPPQCDINTYNRISSLEPQHKLVGLDDNNTRNFDASLIIHIC